MCSWCYSMSKACGNLPLQGARCWWWLLLPFIQSNGSLCHVCVAVFGHAAWCLCTSPYLCLYYGLFLWHASDARKQTPYKSEDSWEFKCIFFLTHWIPKLLIVGTEVDFVFFCFGLFSDSVGKKKQHFEIHTISLPVACKWEVNALFYYLVCKEDGFLVQFIRSYRQANVVTNASL